MRLFAWKEAGLVLKRGIDVAKANGEEPYPLLYYYRAYAESAPMIGRREGVVGGSPDAGSQD